MTSIDSRDSKVLFVVEIPRESLSDKLAASFLYAQKHGMGEKWISEKEQMFNEVQPDSASWSTNIGYIGDDRKYPVTISVSIWRRKHLGTQGQPLLATWSLDGDYTDRTMGENYVKNCLLTPRVFPAAAMLYGRLSISLVKNIHLLRTTRKKGKILSSGMNADFCLRMPRIAMPRFPKNLCITSTKIKNRRAQGCPRVGDV